LEKERREKNEILTCGRKIQKRLQGIRDCFSREHPEKLEIHLTYIFGRVI